MRQLVLGLVSLILSVTGPAAQAAPDASAPVRQVILVQNSGWMEPFYRDPNSRFRELVTSLASLSNLQGVDLVVASFNQDGETPGHPSPETLFEGPYDAAGVANAAQRLDLPHKASGAYADADFHGALMGAINRLLHGGQGVIWMITNNKDSPDNSQEVVSNTQRFYALLRTSPYITRIAAFPIRDDVAGPHFQEKGFIVYAFAYGDRAALALDVILRDGAPVRALFRSPPVRLKPLDQNPIELLLAKTSEASRLGASVDNGVLTLRRVPGGPRASIVLQGLLRNTYYPQAIDTASLTVHWRSADPDLAQAGVSITPQVIGGLRAGGGVTPVSVTLELPATPRRGPLFGIFDNDRPAMGVLGIELHGMQFSLDPEFLQRIASISGTEEIRQSQAEALVSEQLPAVFLDYKRVSDATTDIPVAVDLRYSPLPLILLLLFTAAILGAGMFFFFWTARPRSYSVRTGAGEQTISIRPFESRIISDGYGVRSHVRGALFGGPSVRAVDDGKSAAG